MSAEKKADDIGCHNCPKAACCLEGQIADFTRPEAARRERQGSKLLLLYGEGDVRTYEFLNDCGSLRTDPATGHRSCGDYENRPKACKTFKAGGFSCRVHREFEGVIPSGVPEDWLSRDHDDEP